MAAAVLVVGLVAALIGGTVALIAGYAWAALAVYAASGVASGLVLVAVSLWAQCRSDRARPRQRA